MKNRILRQRGLILFPVLILVISLSWFVSAAEEVVTQPLELSVSSAEGRLGETVEITVNVSNNPGLASLKCQVTYDSVLTLTNVEFDSAFGEIVTSPVPYKNLQTLAMISPLTEVSANGVFATLTFRISEDAKAGDQANISFSYEEDDIFDGDYQNIVANITNGTVTVKGEEVSVLKGDVNGDGIVDMKDAAMLQRHVLKIDIISDENALAAAELTGDGVVDMKDAAKLTRYVIKVIDSLDVESAMVTSFQSSALAEIGMAGDVNRDKKVNNKDAVALYRYASGWDVAADVYAVDVNGDHTVDTEDAMELFRYVSGWENVTLDYGHSLAITEAQAPTCTEDGNIAYWRCGKCDKYFSDAQGKYEITLTDTVVKTNGHSFESEWSYDEYAHWHDAVCEHSEEIADYTEHTFIDHQCSVCKVGQTFTVIFVDYDGSVIDIQQIPYGAAATTPSEIPERSGYIFDGWDTVFTNVGSNLTVKAQYEKAYIVTFVDFDGAVLKQETVKNGGNATAYEFGSAELPPEGYNRTGWDKSFDNITGDITVFATYERKVYTVTFYMPDGSLIETKKVEHGTDVEEPICSERYFDWNKYRMGTFSGWSRSLKEIKSDEVIYAQYQNEFEQPVISIVTTDDSVSIKLYAPKDCYLYAIDFGFNWFGNIAITGYIKNSASNLYKGKDGGYSFDYNNKYNQFHYTWTDAAGVGITGNYTTIADIEFDVDGGFVVNKEALTLFGNCMIIYGTEPKANVGNLQTIIPIIVVK